MAFVTSTTRRNIHIPDEMDSDSFIVPDGYGFNTTTVLIPVEVAVRFTVAQLAILAGIDVTRASVISIDACDDDLVVYVNAARD